MEWYQYQYRLHQWAIERGFVVSEQTLRLIIKILDPEEAELRRVQNFFLINVCLYSPKIAYLLC